MSGQVLVELKDTRHIAIIGGVGLGKTTYARYLVGKALQEHDDLQVIVYGARDKKWEALEHLGFITLYSMEDTITGRLRDTETYLDTDKETLVVIDDISYTLHMLPSEEHEAVINRLHKLLTSENVFSIITSLRPLNGYYPKELLDLANTKIALNVENDFDYTSFFQSKAYKTNNECPQERGQAFIDTKTTRDPILIQSSRSITLK